MQNLVIVESNAKAKTIEKYLAAAEELKGLGTFQVVASLGHVVDLPPKEMGVDMETWQMRYVPIAGKSETIQRLHKMVKAADRVYLAADPDREGEAIAKNLYDLLKLRKVPTHRVTFHEITKRAVTNAIQNPREIDHALVEAQEARRILDRVVGYELSPLLWRRFASPGLSAGRVQTAALRMVVDRAQEIEAFKPEPVWEVHGSFDLGETLLGGGPHHDVKALIKELARKGGSVIWVASFRAKKSKSSPSAPFTTSTLQQEAYNRHRMGAKRVMQLAQALYEAGHITYMRTDSTSLSEEAKKVIHAHIARRFGQDAVVGRSFHTSVANAQEAHECIRPTHPDVFGLKMSEKITDEHQKVYDLIWRRTIASQMASAVYVELTLSVTSDPQEMPVLGGRAFLGTTRVLVEKGYLIVWQPDAEARQDLGEELLRKAGQEGLAASPLGFEAVGDVTRPPSLYREPQLVQALEKEGIGRPSTYATILDKIFQRNYVYRGPNPQAEHRVVHYRAHMDSGKVSVEEGTVAIGGKETDRIAPTPLGRRVAEYLEEAAPDAVSIAFTARMEQELDNISNGALGKAEMLSEFYKGFQAALPKEKAKPSRPAGEAKKGPQRVIRDLGNARVVETRYGPALFLQDEERFVSVLPYLEWRQKTMDALGPADIEFLRKLPITLSSEPAGNGATDTATATIELHLGRYGLYAKKDGANHRIPRDMWDRLYDGEVSYAELEKALTQNPGPRQPTGRGRAQTRAPRGRKPRS